MIEWYYFALISSILLGVYSVVEKLALKNEHATAFTSAFSIIAAAMSLPLLLFANFDLTYMQLFLIFANGTIMALTYLLAARIFKHGSISVASAAFGSLPSVFVALLAIPLLGEHLTVLQYVSIAVISVIIYLLLFERGLGKDFESNKYRIMVLVRSLLVAMQAVLTKYLLGSVDVPTLLFLCEIFMAFDFAVFISVKYGGIKEIVFTIRSYALPIILMAALTVGFSLTYFLSLTGADVSLVTPVRNTVYVVMAVILGGMLFNEDELKKKLALSAILLIFTYLLIAA
ncbi:EamA-like transporter family protein [uncultured archaeon]|nr:EamA-like transporter family protein [uncultured archaeon]